MEIKLAKSDLKVIKTMRRCGGSATTRVLFLETEIDEAYLWERIKKLMDLGLVVRVGRGRYALTDKYYELFPPKQVE